MNNDHPKVKFGKTGVLLINLGTPNSTSWWEGRGEDGGERREEEDAAGDRLVHHRSAQEGSGPFLLGAA